MIAIDRNEIIADLFMLAPTAFVLRWPKYEPSGLIFGTIKKVASLQRERRVTDKREYRLWRVVLPEASGEIRSRVCRPGAGPSRR